jgi:hypothetical protein
VAEEYFSVDCEEDSDGAGEQVEEEDQEESLKEL